jgi:hypothetical protein
VNDYDVELWQLDRYIWTFKAPRCVLSDIASLLPFARLDFRFGLKREVQVAVYRASVLIPNFPGACTNLLPGASRLPTLPQVLLQPIDPRP